MSKHPDVIRSPPGARSPLTRNRTPGPVEHPPRTGSRPGGGGGMNDPWKPYIDAARAAGEPFAWVPDYGDSGSAWQRVEVPLEPRTPALRADRVRPRHHQ